MDIKVEELSPVERKLIVAVPPQNVAQQMEQAYRQWGKRAKIKGFRPGKVPRMILKRFFGKEIEEQVSQELFRQSLNEALDEAKLQPVSVRMPNALPPLIEGDPFSFSVEVEVAPEFTAKDYLNLTVTSTPVEVTEAMVDERLKELRQYRSELEPVEEDRPVREKDFVFLKYQALEQGEPIEGGGSDDAYLEVGAGKLPAEFEQRLVGLTKGTTTSFEMTVPADFVNPAIAGKTVEFQVEILDIREVRVPELDDALAQSFSPDFKTLADLRDAVRRDLERRQEKENYEKMRQQVIDQIVARNPVEVPPSLVRQEQENMVRQQLNLLQSRGLNISGLNIDSLMEKVKDQAEKTTRVNLILNQIANQEGITVSEEDVAAGYQRIAAQVGDTPEMVRKVYEQRQMVADFKSQIRAEKTLEFLIDRATSAPGAAGAEAAEDIAS
ncbi:MAG: trigger factor [Desulfobacca sp.]|uniref:trigger factor n=1 Tax=Desulfobacca sp. TaxID=2067990 RepID=UPI00404B7E9F